MRKLRPSEKVEILQFRLCLFASCIMRKHFLLWTKETAFFGYFYNEIIFYSAELFDCAVNFKFYLNIFIFLNITQIKHQKSNIWIKKQPLQDQLFKEFLEVRCHVCNFTGVLCFMVVFEDFGHIFLTSFLQNFW